AATIRTRSAHIAGRPRGPAEFPAKRTQFESLRQTKVAEAGLGCPHDLRRQGRELREILRKCLLRGPDPGSRAFSPCIWTHNFYATLPEPLTFDGNKLSEPGVRRSGPATFRGADYSGSPAVGTGHGAAARVKSP